jgi:hypothetical protein
MVFSFLIFSIGKHVKSYSNTTGFLFGEYGVVLNLERKIMIGSKFVEISKMFRSYQDLLLRLDWKVKRHA